MILTIDPTGAVPVSEQIAEQIRFAIATGRLDWLKVFLLAGGYTLVAVYFKPPGLFQPRLMTPLASYHLAGNFLIWAMTTFTLYLFPDLLKCADASNKPFCYLWLICC